MKTVTIEIKGASGLHARPAGLLAAEAQKYQSAITIKKGERSINAKSIMSVLSLGAVKGDQVTIEADGEDEAIACDSIVTLFDTVLAHA